MKRLTIYLFLILLFPCMAFGQATDDPIAKTYRVIYKTVEAFQPIIQSMLSNRGVIQTSPALNMFVVIDRQLYLDRIDSLITYFDVPAQQFLINIQLIEGSDNPNAISAPDSLNLHALLDSMYTYTTYSELDNVYLRVEEKISTELTMARGKYNIAIQIDYIPAFPQPLIRFRQLILNEVALGIAGRETRPIFITSAEVRENVREIFAAFREEKTGNTLILIVTVFRV